MVAEVSASTGATVSVPSWSKPPVASESFSHVVTEASSASGVRLISRVTRPAESSDFASFCTVIEAVVAVPGATVPRTPADNRSSTEDASDSSSAAATALPAPVLTRPSTIAEMTDPRARRCRRVRRPFSKMVAVMKVFLERRDPRLLVSGDLVILGRWLNENPEDA